ncbi:F5/8 type C domain protein [compost metagenome]
MGVPATTGSLKTKVEDMKIGDYIICKYAATSGAVGKFSEIGTSVATEIALNGAAAPNGTFYFIKVDTGLLIADRVVQNTISWDVLNAGRYIQGTFGVGSSIPIMTSNTAPRGVITSNITPLATTFLYNAFDNNTTTFFHSQAGTTKGWLAYEFATSTKIIGYSILSQADYGNRCPKNWTFEGSNNGSTWTVLDERQNENVWINNKKNKYFFANNVSYKMYRINISANNGAEYLTFAEMEMFESNIDIRSLTGGVSYADANGNSSTTDQSKGAWPINNEWDKYIVNFPIAKIQAGKTFNDVFNNTTSNPLSYVQETPITSFAASTYRVLRRGAGFGWVVSSTSNVTTGFRPVFEYKEV